MQLSPIAEKILQRKYYQPGENFDKLCFRVAWAIAGAETTEDQRKYWAGVYYSLMNNLWFLPAGRILANAGVSNSLFNCYVLGIEDSKSSIYATLATGAEIFARGGGIGYNFSTLREHGANVANGSEASGPVPFLKLFNTSANIISQASRRGAQMGILNIDHPDILTFIKVKDKEGELDHFNLSVGLTDEFMQAVQRGDTTFKLRSRYSKTTQTVNPQTL